MKKLSEKPGAKKKAKKSQKASRPKSRKSSLTKPVRAVQKSVLKQAEKIDQVLLRLAAQPYSRIMKQIELGRKRLDSERRIALELGSRILVKAKEVRDSLIQRTKSVRGE